MAEFPNFGKHCSKEDCNMLDFLPVICDACREPYCVNHFQYLNHSCTKAKNKDRQVPVCPICCKPVPIPQGRSPDEVINAHLDGNCATPSKRSIPCDLKGCKKREFVEVSCRECKHNFCLSHRFHEQHFCKGNRPNEMLKVRNTVVPKVNTTEDENLARTLQMLWNSNQISDEELARRLQEEENRSVRTQYGQQPRINTGASRGNSNCTIS
uniref:AN1-type domain-containing protein n=1 Tax=Panagrolaimus superbus TaxID=310955 RepID=A0A914Z5I6_9BILA